MKVAVIGSTGVVGNVMLNLLESRNFPVSDLIPVASERSIGKKILFINQEYDIVSIEDEINLKTQAYEHGLLKMGPDCGTAILNGVPLSLIHISAPTRPY